MKVRLGALFNNKKKQLHLFQSTSVYGRWVLFCFLRERQWEKGRGGDFAVPPPLPLTQCKQNTTWISDDESLVEGGVAGGRIESRLI